MCNQIIFRLAYSSFLDLLLGLYIREDPQIEMQFLQKGPCGTPWARTHKGTIVRCFSGLIWILCSSQCKYYTKTRTEYFLYRQYSISVLEYGIRTQYSYCNLTVRYSYVRIIPVLRTEYEQ